MQACLLRQAGNAPRLLCLLYVLISLTHCSHFIPFLFCAVEQFAASRLVVEFRVRAVGLGRSQLGRPQLQQWEWPWRSLCQPASSLAIPGPGSLRSQSLRTAAHLTSGKEVRFAVKPNCVLCFLQAMAFNGHGQLAEILIQTDPH